MRFCHDCGQGLLDMTVQEGPNGTLILLCEPCIKQRRDSPDAGRVERVARAIYEAFPQQYVSTVHFDHGQISDPVTAPATWDDEPEGRRDFVRELARAAIGAIG